MSATSPLRLRRAASVASVDPHTIEPIKTFGYDQWELPISEEPRILMSSPFVDERITDPQTASARNFTGGGAKRLHIDTSHNEPETPLRKIRGQSVSIYGQHGLVTPQSVNRSFSTPSLGMLSTPDSALPSPLTTPLVTPMSSTLENPFDSIYESKFSSGWNIGFDFSANPPSHAARSNSTIPEVMRSSSVSSQYSRSDEDGSYTPMSSSNGSKQFLAKADVGVNPFYCPPACLRESPVKPHIAGEAFRSISDLGRPISPIGEDAGVSSGNLNGIDPDTYSFISEENVSNDSQEIGEHPEFDYYPFSRLNDISFQNLSTQQQPVSDMLGKSRSRSSSLASSTSTDTEKPYKCTSCTKGFRRMEHLRRHQKTHTMERPFVCSVANCGRRFSRTDNLKAHVLTHTKKTGRNVYVEGLAETGEVKPIKPRKSRQTETDIIV